MGVLREWKEKKNLKITRSSNSCCSFFLPKHHPVRICYFILLEVFQSPSEAGKNNLRSFQSSLSPFCHAATTLHLFPEKSEQQQPLIAWACLSPYNTHLVLSLTQIQRSACFYFLSCSDSVKEDTSSVFSHHFFSELKDPALSFLWAGITVQRLIVSLPLSTWLMSCAPLCLHIIL